MGLNLVQLKLLGLQADSHTLSTLLRCKLITRCVAIFQSIFETTIWHFCYDPLQGIYSYEFCVNPGTFKEIHSPVPKIKTAISTWILMLPEIKFLEISVNLYCKHLNSCKRHGDNYLSLHPFLQLV